LRLAGGKEWNYDSLGGPDHRFSPVVGYYSPEKCSKYNTQLAPRRPQHKTGRNGFFEAGAAPGVFFQNLEGAEPSWPGND